MRKNNGSSNTIIGKELYGTPVVMLLSNVRIEKKPNPIELFLKS